jgi:cyclophilin family peptidyl-prolyl cis-trans isomerase
MRTVTWAAPVFCWLAICSLVSSLPAADAPAAAKPGPQAAEYQKTLAELKGVLVELGMVQSKYRTAPANECRELQKQWDQLTAQGDGLQGKLVEDAEKVFVEAPNTDRGVVGLLLDAADDYARADDFERSLRLAELLVKNKCPDLRAANLAGVSAYAVGDFEAAEKYLRAAQAGQAHIGIGRDSIGPGRDRDAVDAAVATFLQDPAPYQEAWARETRLRQAEAQADDLPRVLLRTSKGDIEVELFENEAPNTVANFISLVEKKFYDNAPFHRVLPRFMAQGGDPTGTGSGGPGYEIDCECQRPDYRLHFRGSISMAHAGPNTGGSQFFLTFIPTRQLDGKHTVFGRITKGFDVLAKIQRRDPEDKQRAAEITPDKIVEAKVLRKRNHPYEPKTHPSSRPSR